MDAREASRQMSVIPPDPPASKSPINAPLNEPLLPRTEPWLDHLASVLGAFFNPFAEEFVRWSIYCKNAHWILKKSC